MSDDFRIAHKSGQAINRLFDWDFWSFFHVCQLNLVSVGGRDFAVRNGQFMVQLGITI